MPSWILIALRIARKGIPLVRFSLCNSVSTLVAVFNCVTSALVYISVCMIVIAFMVLLFGYLLYGYSVHYVTKKDPHF
jgi:hypothetical protein